MGKKEVVVCDCCGQVKEPDELTHSVTIVKKGGPGAYEKPDVCVDCAKAIHGFIEKRGEPKAKRGRAPKAEGAQRKKRKPKTE